MELLFPFESQRPVQKEMITDVAKCIAENKHLIAHAPTGLGKTAASLSPALNYAIENGKNIIFLTPKHTQHQIVVETLRKVKEKNKANVNVVDFIGKRWMCLVPGVQTLTSRDFAEYCREVKKDERCIFHNKVWKKNEVTREAKKLIDELKKDSPLHVEEVCSRCGKEEVCPYEISCQLAKSANVIIADYYHIFHPSVRKAFLMRIGKELSDCIIVVDEAQNLPNRIREVLSSTISNFSLNRAVKEARKAGYEELANDITEIYNVLVGMTQKELSNKEECYIQRDEFIAQVEQIGKDFEEFAGDLLLIGEKIRTENKVSYVGSIGSFLQQWLEEGDGFVRILRKSEWKEKSLIQLNFRCLDPALASKELFEECHSAILMSGTLTPTRMYRDILGMSEERTKCKEYDNPFPKVNRLSLIIPDTTTRYARRKPEEFQKIADWCAQVVNTIPGNVAVFFPSYYVRDKIAPDFEKKSRKSIFSEQQGLSKRERYEMLEQFKEYSDLGAVFLGVTGGSFGEGIDLPGKFLRGVVVVGVPLDSPDLETQSLIDYYEKLFGSGWDYGYIFPAMNRVVQAAGRAIRSETDRGIVVLIDERFTWKNYFKCLPIEWQIIVTKNPVDRIKKFFETKQ